MSTGNRFIAGAGALFLAQAFAVPSGWAQTQTAPPVANKPAPVTPATNAPDTVSITIFGRPRGSGTPGNRLTTIDLGRSASGCGFMSQSSSQSAIDDYFDDFYGADQPEDAGNGRQRINTRSPYGDASGHGGLRNDTPDNTDQTSQRAMDPFGVTTSGAGGCTQAEINFAGARAEIAAHDHSLKDAFAAYDDQDYPRALELFKYSWNKIGYPIAGLMIGKMYLVGMGIPRDTTQAIVWLKRVADLPYTPPSIPRPPRDYNAMTPSVDASMTLAKIYIIGWDVPVSRDEARRWYARADDLDFYPATHLMGRIYLGGYGMPRDVKKAITYFKRAGQMGYAPSQYAMGQIYYDGDDGVPQDKTLAGAWLLLAAKHDYPDALYAVGRMYELGEGGAKIDPAKALGYYKEAAVRGQADAQTIIGTDFYLGTGLPQNLDYARKWFLRAAENGNPDAMFNLAVMMVNGEGGSKDLVHAYCWFYIAQQGGNDKAGAALAELAPKMTAEERAQADALLNPPAAK